MRNPFKPPQLRHDDPFKNKTKVPNELNWADDSKDFFDPEVAGEYLDEVLRQLNAELDPVSDPNAQDALYQKGYNEGSSGLGFDTEYVDDPNYWMGYQDGRGDADNIDTTDLGPQPMETNFKTVEDVHNAVDNIFEKRKLKRTYYPIFIDGGTRYQCEDCKFIRESEIEIKNHIRQAHA